MAKRSPRTGPRGHYNPEQTRRSILEAALALFENQGFHATSVQEIADRAKVTKGAFYHHFESKDELLQIIHDEFVDSELAEIRQIRADNDSPLEQLRKTIEMSVLSVVRYRSQVTVYLQERRFLTGEPFEAVKRKRDATVEEMEGMVREGIERGELRSDLDPRITVLGIVGMCAWAYQWLRDDGPAPAEEVASRIADIALHGVADAGK